MRRKSPATLAAICILAASFPGTASAQTTTAEEDAARISAADIGLRVVGDEKLQPVVPSGARERWNEALNQALDRPEDFAYPWVDESGTVKVRAANMDGFEAAMALREDFQSSGRIDVEESSISIAELDRLRDPLTRLSGTGIPNSDLVWMTYPDFENNRIVVTVGEARPALLNALADRFGTELIEIRVEPVPEMGQPASRDRDASPFYGGAKVNGCTTGFSWDASPSSAMVTAGHCYPSGGSASYPDFSNVGTVQSLYEESWDSYIGTTKMVGQSQYRGDIALIRYKTGYTSTGRTYEGGVGGSSNKAVAGTIGTFSMPNDAACANGRASGEHCGNISHNLVDIQYPGTGEWARSIGLMNSSNGCIIGGDSGGPVYRRRSDGRLTAIGIISGFVTMPACYIVFTDIRHAYLGFPGDIKTQPA